MRICSLGICNKIQPIKNFTRLNRNGNLEVFKTCNECAQLARANSRAYYLREKAKGSYRQGKKKDHYIDPNLKICLQCTLPECTKGNETPGCLLKIKERV